MNLKEMFDKTINTSFGEVCVMFVGAFGMLVLASKYPLVGVLSAMALGIVIAKLYILRGE